MMRYSQSLIFVLKIHTKKNSHPITNQTNPTTDKFVTFNIA